jgi:integrase
MASAKRGERGEGSVFYEKARRRWVVLTPRPKSSSTGRRRGKRTFRTRAEAIAWLASEPESQIEEPDPLVCDLLAGWQASERRRVDAGDLSVSTADLYDLCIRHISAALGSRPANEVNVEDVERFLARQSERLSARYVSMQRNVLDQAYRWAQRNRLLTWNPAQLAARPSRLGHKQGTVLTVEEARRLLEVSRDHPLHPLWAVMVGVGLRPGEAMGLTWPCVDLGSDPGVLHVRHYLRRGADGMFLGAPKTVQSARSLDMPVFVSNALRAHLEGSETRAEGPWRDLVFATGAGTPHGHRNLRRALRGLCEQAGLPALTLYDLRRTAGSLLVDAGVHLECVADLLGHSSVATTRRHYVRAVRPTVPHAVGLDALIGPTRPWRGCPTSSG